MWERIMYWGGKLGCHQRPDRSFYFHGKQFPLCARCTGVLAGQILAVGLYGIVRPQLPMCAGFCLVLFADWLIQYLKILESTNCRRFITGILCGYGMLSMELAAAEEMYRLLQTVFQSGN